MIPIGAQTRILVAVDPADFRKGIDGRIFFFAPFISSAADPFICDVCREKKKRDGHFSGKLVPWTVCHIVSPVRRFRVSSNMRLSVESLRAVKRFSPRMSV